MKWQVTAARTVVKQLRRLPRKIVLIYAQLVEDMEQEGPHPFGWDVKPLQGEKDCYRIRLTREYRVVITVVSPQIIIITVAHRKEVYR